MGPYDLDWGMEQYKCWISQAITFVLLSCLQVINIIWLVYVLRVARNYVFNNDRRDERSDDEDEEEEVDEDKDANAVEPRADSEKITQKGQ